MAIVRKSAIEAWSAGKVDIAKVRATMERDVERQMLEDGEHFMSLSDKPLFSSGATQHQRISISPVVQQRVWTAEARQLHNILDAA